MRIRPATRLTREAVGVYQSTFFLVVRLGCRAGHAKVTLATTYLSPIDFLLIPNLCLGDLRSNVHLCQVNTAFQYSLIVETTVSNVVTFLVGSF